VDDVIAEAARWLALRQAPTLVSISAGMSAELILDALYLRFGDAHSFVDFGSLWDPLVGVYSRKYMRTNS
jgi:hypothetical protein